MIMVGELHIVFRSSHNHFKEIKGGMGKPRAIFHEPKCPILEFNLLEVFALLCGLLAV